MFKQAVTLLCLLVAAAVVAQDQYCGSVDPATASGASGSFAMQIYNGVGQYSFNLDLNEYIGYNCNFTQGLSYHIHTFWKNDSVSSSAGSFCGASFCGGHYDPNFACSGSSQNASSGCTALGRTAAQGYTYSCNAAAYANGEYSRCEVGDISGKNGVAYPVSDTDLSFSLTDFVDYQPPYAYNYKTQDQDSLMWSSIVFHCAADNTRLVCAELSNTNLVPCAVDLNSFSTGNNDNNDDDKQFTDTDLTVAIVVCTIVAGLMGVAAGYAWHIYAAKKSGDTQWLTGNAV
eukprot:gene29834-36024_t